MTRLYLALGAFALVGFILAAVYFLGGQSARQGNALDRANDTINSSEEFNDAVSRSGGCTWFDRVQRACPD